MVVVTSSHLNTPNSFRTLNGGTEAVALSPIGHVILLAYVEIAVELPLRLLACIVVRIMHLLHVIKEIQHARNGGILMIKSTSVKCGVHSFPMISSARSLPSANVGNENYNFFHIHSYVC